MPSLTRSASIAGLVGIGVLIILAQASLESENVPKVCIQVAADSAYGQGLIHRLYLLHTFKVIVEYGFLFFAIPSCVACTLELLNRHRCLSPALLLLSSSLNAILYTIIFLFLLGAVFGIPTELHQGWSAWDIFLHACYGGIGSVIILGSFVIPLSICVSVMRLCTHRAGIELA